MSTKPKFPPDRVEILPPMRTLKRPRGAMAQDNADPQRTIRISDKQLATIDEGARLLDVTRSEFIRWVSYCAANELIRAHNASK